LHRNRRLYLYRRPDLLDGVVTAFLFMLRANDAVGSVVATVIDAAVLVSPYHAFIGQYPQEATGTARMVAHHFPVVKQASSQTTIV